MNLLEVTDEEIDEQIAYMTTVRRNRKLLLARTKLLLYTLQYRAKPLKKKKKEAGR